MGTYEYKDGNYHLTKVNEPAESVQMCNMRDVCVTDYGDEIAKDAAPEVNEKSENELNGGSQGIEPIIPEGEDEIIQVKKRVEESSPNSVNETTTLANVNSTTTIANVESTTVLITVESTTLNIDNTTKLIDQTTTTVSNENVSSSSPSNIPESENEENNSTPLVSKNTTEILSELGSGVEVTSKPNEDTSTIQITTDTTSKSNLEELKKDEPINFSTTEGTSNSTTPENITGSTPTLSSELETTTSSVINNQETTTSSISSTTTSAELDTSSEVSINSKLNLNVTTNNTSLNSNESKEFDNSNENNNNNNDNTSSIKLQDTTTSQILSSTTTDIPTTTTTLNGGEQTLTTTIVPGESLTTTTVTVESTTTTNNDNNTTTSLDSINTSTPQTINKFLESHESNNSKENKDAINQLKNDNNEKANTCSPTHKDLYICESYMNEYLNRVDTWAKQRGETLDNQLWKACSLLKKVPHVPTLCCQIFNFKCGSHITAPPPSTTISTLV
uniref:SCP domain-containing protein n=1 Tax=Parastrongyloides trichosuri TaxID=131310 RepID=A0A0N4Z6R2_PARTI